MWKQAKQLNGKFDSAADPWTANFLDNRIMSQFDPPNGETSLNLVTALLGDCDPVIPVGRL